MQKSYQTRFLLTDKGIEENITVELADDGTISQFFDKPVAGSIPLNGFVIPGFVNGHSHAFQYAMAGLAEEVPKDHASDNFWSWREAMYKLALSISPQQLEAIATVLYSEMLRNGYTNVVEFHYVHRAPDGEFYPAKGEMSCRLLRAAKNSGINITLAPVFYNQGGFGTALQANQRRFKIDSIDQYQILLDDVHTEVSRLRHGNVGVAIHSLRAVTQTDLRAILDKYTEYPVHIHIAEQKKEIHDCIEFYKQTPVQFLYANTDRESLNLVHATHLHGDELELMVKHRANVVLCPSTEANLGDGIFPFRDYVQEGGRWSIGSDSHVGLSPMEELRWLEYGQRLTLLERNTVCTPDGQTGDLLYEQAWIGGQEAAGLRANQYFSKGAPFDAIELDLNHPALINKPLNRCLSTLVFAGDASCIEKVIANGKVKVDRGQHVDREPIVTEYRQVMNTQTN